MSDWQPRTVRTVQVVDPSPVAALSALLDSGAPAPGIGDMLPPLWHWVALPRWAPSSVLGLDGHPRRGDFLPPLPHPRRMFAGGEVKVHGDVRVGSAVVVESVVASVVEKEGRSGQLAVVQVCTSIKDGEDDSLLLEERQDLIYRPATSSPIATIGADTADPAAMTPAGPPLQRHDDAWLFRTDPTLLMRFSAATANAHRIHYDWPYATQVEGYPGLVVHGPLATIVLAEVHRLEQLRPVRRLTHRNMAPLFCGATAAATVRHPSTNTVEVALARDSTQLAHLEVELVPEIRKGNHHDH